MPACLQLSFFIISAIFLCRPGSSQSGQYGMLCEFDEESTANCVIRSPVVDTAVHNWSCISFWLEMPDYTNVVLTAKLLQLNSTSVVSSL